MRHLTLILTILVLIFLFTYQSTLHPSVSPKAKIELTPLTPDNAPHLTELARFGNGVLTGAAAWSPDGNTLAVGSSLGIWFYNMSDMATEPTLLDTNVGVFDLEYTADGRYLAYRTRDIAAVLDVVSGETVLSVEDGGAITLHPNSEYLAVGMYYPVETEEGAYFGRATVDIWDIKTQTQIMSFEPEIAIDQFSFVSDLVFSPDGHYLAVSFTGPEYTTCGDRSTGVVVWDFTEPQSEHISFREADKTVFSPDSQFLVSESLFMGQSDFLLQFLNLETETMSKLNTMPDYADNYWGYVIWYGFQPVTGQLLTLTDDSKLRFWDVTTQSMTNEIPFDKEIIKIAFSPDGEQAVSVSTSSIHLWTDNFANQVQLPFESPYSSITFLNSGTMFTTYDEQNQLYLWTVGTGGVSEVFVSEALDKDSQQPLLSSHGTYLAYVAGQQLKIWNTVENSLLITLNIEADTRLFPESFSNDGQYILTRYVDVPSATEQRVYLQVRTIQTGTVLRQFGSFSSASGRFSADGTEFSIMSESNQYTIYSMSTDDLLFHYQLEQDGYASFSPNLSYLIINETAYDNPSNLSVIATDTGEIVAESMILEGGWITQYSADNSYMMLTSSSVNRCGGDYRNLFVLELPSLQRVAGGGLPSARPGEWGGVVGEFSADSSMYFSANSLYVTQTGERLVTLPFGQEIGMKFSEDNKSIIINDRGAIRLWGVPSTDE